MSGRQQRVMVQPIVRELPNPDFSRSRARILIISPAECHFQEPPTGTSVTAWKSFSNAFIDHFHLNLFFAEREGRDLAVRQYRDAH